MSVIDPISRTPDGTRRPGRRPGPLPVDGSFSVSVREPVPGVVVVSPAGEIDSATAGSFRAAALDAVHTASRHLVVDLAAVTFMGSTALAVLVDVHDAARSRDLPWCPAGAGRSARRVLQLTGLDAELGLRADADTVLDQLRR